MVGFVGVCMDPYDQDGCQQIPPKFWWCSQEGEGPCEKYVVPMTLKLRWSHSETKTSQFV